ncbi:MAG: hypothetical protein LBI18_14030, partial [Planctomycetaceae bacterium]|nr:hypothetical protein [Planctomycetaceae bacterium]
HKYIEKELPALHNAIRLGSKAGDRIEYFAIAPVYETVPKTDPATGKVEPVPKKNFKSYGIVGSGSISNWIIKSVTTRKMWMSWKKVRPKVVQRKNEFAYSGAIFLAIFGAIIGLVYFSNHGWTRYTTAYWGQNWQSGAELLKQNYWFLLGWFFAAIFGSIYIAISSLIFAIIGFLGGTAVGAVWGFTEGGGLLMVPEYGLRLITISAIYLAKGTIYGIKQLCALTAKNFVIVYKQVRVFFANNI